jgi:hypothetical protein
MMKGMPVPTGNVTIEVRISRRGDKGSIRTLVNGKKIVEWEGDISRLSPHKDFKSERVIIAPYEAGYELKDVRREVLTAPSPSGVHMQTITPAIEAEDAEPTKPKGLQEFEKKMSVKATWNKQTGSWYFKIPNKLTFADATRSAIAFGATIAIVDSAEENGILRAMGKGENQWLGYVKNPSDGKLYSMDGNVPQYTNLQSDEGKNPKEQFIQMHGSDRTMGRLSGGPCRDHL